MTTRRSQHAKEQEWSELEVNQVPSTRNKEEERTEVLRNNEEEQSKPAAEGTGIPYDIKSYSISNQHHTTKRQDLPVPKPQKYK